MPDKGVFIIRNKISKRVYVGSSDDNVDELLRSYWQKLKKGNFRNAELQDDFTKFGADNFEKKIVNRTFKHESEVQKYQLQLKKKYKDNCYNSREKVSYGGGNPDARFGTSNGERNSVIEDLLNVIDKSKLPQYNKNKLKQQISDGNITNESQLKHAMDLFIIDEDKKKPTYSSNTNNRQGQVLKFLSNKQRSLSDVDQLRNISVNDVMHWYKNSKNEGSVFSNFHIELKDSRPDIAEEIEIHIKDKNNNLEKTSSNINVSASNNVNKKSITNNNVNKKVSKNKNNTKTPFTKTSWYKEVIKPLMVQLNQYDLDDVDRKILKRKINSYKIRNSKDLEIEYLKLIKYKNNGSNELLDENNEYDDSPIKKTNRYRDELLNQLNQYNNLTDTKKNRLAKKINKGQIQTSWHLEEEVFGIQKKTKVKKQKHLNNHVPKQKQLDNNVAEQKHSNNKKNSLFNKILNLFHR